MSKFFWEKDINMFLLFGAIKTEKFVDSGRFKKNLSSIILYSILFLTLEYTIFIIIKVFL